MLALLAYSAAATLVNAQEPPGPVSNSADNVQGQTAPAIAAFWTQERMNSAVARDIPGTLEYEPRGISGQAQADPEPPGILPGWNPASGKPQPTLADAVTYPAQGPQLIAGQAFGSPPSNPVNYSNYGKFNRWTWYGRYLTYPTSVIGKLFFTLGGSNFVCSGTVVQRNMVYTAGHCVHDGVGSFATNLLFCPSYNNGGVNSAVGCWPVASGANKIWTTGPWSNSSDFDYDTACFVTANSGTVLSQRIGNVTGWAGLAWNFGTDENIMATGYPAGAPFNGRRIMFVAANEWYSLHTSSGGQASKYIGSDMTGGSSGGGWWLNIGHGTNGVEVADVDGSNVTDPFQNSGTPALNGVNSHKRCAGTHCNTPPSASNGLFWSEMGSPVFASSGSDNNDARDIFNRCAANGGT